MVRALSIASVAVCLVACGSSSEDGGGGKKNTGGVSGNGGGSGSGGSGGSAGMAGDAGLGGASGSGGATSACTLGPFASGKTPLTLTSSGVERTANLYVPKSYDGTKNVPFVMAFHGYLENADQMQDFTGFDAVAEAQGVVVAYPQGLNTSWNAGKCCGTSASSKRPDVQFVSDLIDTVSAKLCIDPKRVYATGFSNGGMFSSRLGCELANRIAALAPVAGPIAMDGCAPSRPLPVIQIHGTGDIVVPYNGNGLGGAISFPAAKDFWTKNAACTDTTAAEVYKKGDATCVESSACAGGAAVRSCTIDGGGHQWPGGKSVGIGKLSMDLASSEEIVKFFLAHPMP